jgi:hypothetical protein
VFVILNFFSLLLQTWNPKSKSEPYAQSASEIVKSAKTTVEEFFQIPIGITEELVQDLADGLETIFQDYMMFVAACGKYCKMYIHNDFSKNLRDCLKEHMETTYEMPINYCL